MANPTDAAVHVVNQALDAIGAKTISEMRDGSKEAEAALRHYGPRLRDMLRSAHWNFARKDFRLALAKDRNNRDGTVPTDVPHPWLYEYLYPQDCVKVRWVPRSGELDDTGDPPLMTNLAPLSTVHGESPAPFVVSNDLAVTAEAIGVGVILTNVRNARLIYTAAVTAPQLWDPLFLTAFSGLLAAWLALPCLDDKKFALEVRAQQAALVKGLIAEARVQNGNESWATQDHLPDWIRIRGAGRWPYGFIGANPVGLGYLSYDALGFPDGSAY
jgi:hypothetical protein